MTTSRFDYVRYDEEATELQAKFKAKFIEVEELARRTLPFGHAHNIALIKLEEAYTWIGKAIRDEQIIRNTATELQESRNNS